MGDFPFLPPPSPPPPPIFAPATQATRKQGTIITVILEVAVGCAVINLTLFKPKYPHTNSPYSVLPLKNQSIFRVVNSLLLETYLIDYASLQLGEN